MQLSLEERTSFRHALYFSNELGKLGTQYATEAGLLNSILQAFDLNLEQFRHAQTWTATHLHLNSDVASLCANYCLVAGEILQLRLLPGDYLHWLETALQALQRLPTVQANHEFELLLSTGKTHMDMGNYEKAKTVFQDVLTLIETHDLNDKRELVQFHLDNLALRTGHLSSVLKREEPSSGSTASGDLFNRASALMLKGHNNEAAQIFGQLLKMAEDNKNPQNEAAALQMLGLVYVDLGQTKRALEYGQRALKLGRENHVQFVVAGALHVIGVSLFNEKAYDEALPYLMESLDIEVARDNQQGIADGYMNIGNVYAIKNDYPKAMEYFQQARLLYAEIGVTHLVKSVDRLISQCNIQMSPIIHILRLNPLNAIIHPLVSPLFQNIRQRWQNFQEQRDYK